MKIPLLISLFLIVNLFVSDAQNCNLLEQWTIQNNEPLSFAKQHDIFFLNKDIGYTVGVAGSMKITRDGGKSWNILHKNKESGTRAVLNSVYFVNENVGFVAGEGEDYNIQNIYTDAVFMKTINGGLSWNKTIVEGINRIHDIKFYNGNYGIGLFWSNEREDLLCKTNDGGKTWTKINSGLTRIESIKFIKAGKNDLIYGYDYENQLVLATINEMGEVVQSYKVPEEIKFRLYFINEKIGFAGNNFKTVDGGESWKNADLPEIQYSSIMHFKDEYHGFILNPIINTFTSEWEILYRIDGTDVFETFDGGISWTNRKSELNCSILGLNHSPDNDVVFFHDGMNEGKIEFDYNSNFAAIHKLGKAMLYPNPCSNQIYVEGDISSDYRIEIYSSNGKTIYESNFDHVVNTYMLLPGSYVLKITLPDKSYSKFFKFIKL